MREKNERTRANYEGTSNGHGRIRGQDKRVGTESASNGQIRSGSTEIHSWSGQLSLFSTADVGGSVREDIGKRGASSNKIEDNNNSSRGHGEDKEHGEFYGESGSPSKDQVGSRQHSNEGNSVKADVNNST